MNKQRILEVSALENGTVIDHIPVPSLFSVISILGLDKVSDNKLTFGANLLSNRIGLKSIVKISNTFFDNKDIDRIALVAPNAKLNVIRNYEVIEKRDVKVPSVVTGIAKCMNPKCITNHENIETRFDVNTINGLELRCNYCEKITDKEHLEIIM